MRWATIQPPLQMGRGLASVSIESAVNGPIVNMPSDPVLFVLSLGCHSAVLSYFGDHHVRRACHTVRDGDPFALNKSHEPLSVGKYKITGKKKTGTREILRTLPSGCVRRLPHLVPFFAHTDSSRRSTIAANHHSTSAQHTIRSRVGCTLRVDSTSKMCCAILARTKPVVQLKCCSRKTTINERSRALGEIYHVLDESARFFSKRVRFDRKIVRFFGVFELKTLKRL